MPEEPNDKKLKKIIAELIQRGLIKKINGKYFLTEKGLRAANEPDQEKIKRVLKINT